MKNVSFILWKKCNRLFGQPNINYRISVGGRVFIVQLFQISLLKIS